MSEPTRVLFVCMGNICRSPTAEGVFRHLVHEAGLDDQFEIDSAGTGSWHEGARPDARASAAAAARGSFHFSEVFDQVDAASRRLLDELRQS